MVNININFSNKWLYSLIIIFVVVVAGFVVNAYGGNNPEEMGHTFSEIAPPEGCVAEQFLMWNGSSWVCEDAIDGYTYEWIIVSWGACSMPCATGTQTGVIGCERDDGDIVEDTYCSGIPPVSTRTCNTQKCTGYGCGACVFGTYSYDKCIVPGGRSSHYLIASGWISGSPGLVNCQEGYGSVQWEIWL